MSQNTITEGDLHARNSNNNAKTKKLLRNLKHFPSTPILTVTHMSLPLLLRKENAKSSFKWHDVDVFDMMMGSINLYVWRFPHNKNESTKQIHLIRVG